MAEFSTVLVSPHNLSYTSTRTCFSSRLTVRPWCKPQIAGLEVKRKQHGAREQVAYYAVVIRVCRSHVFGLIILVGLRSATHI